MARLLRSASTRASGLVTRMARLAGRRATIVAVALGWFTATGVFAVAGSADAPTLLALTTLGLVVIVTLQVQRHTGVVVRELRAQLAQLRKSAPPAAPTSVGPGLADQVDEVLDRLKLTALSLGRLSEDLARAAERTREAITAETERATRRLEALQNLYAVVPVTGRVPPMQGSGAPPELTVRLVDVIRTERPGLVVECGGGVSTLWCALAIRQFHVDARVVALEHDEQVARRMTDLLTAEGLADLAEVRHAPLEPVTVGGLVAGWYSGKAWADLDGVGLLSVSAPVGDPPPDGIRHNPAAALWLLAERLVDNGVIALDARTRHLEPDLVDRWLAATTTVVGDHDPLDGTTVLLRHRAAPGALPRHRTTVTRA